MKRGKVTKVFDGDRVVMPARTHRFICCDCDLVHVLQFRMTTKGKLSFRAWRDQRATGQRRRHSQGK